MGTANRPPAPRGTDPRTQELLREIHEWVHGILPPVVTNGALIKDVVMAPSATVKVAHKLGHNPQGWWVVRARGASPVIYESTADQSHLTLVAESGQSATVTFDLWVF